MGRCYKISKKLFVFMFCSFVLVSGSIFGQENNMQEKATKVFLDIRSDRQEFVKKEIPFVVGVLADLSGNPEKPLPKLKDRKFIEIDRDNFNSVLYLPPDKIETVYLGPGRHFKRVESETILQNIRTRPV